MIISEMRYLFLEVSDCLDNGYKSIFLIRETLKNHLCVPTERPYRVLPMFLKEIRLVALMRRGQRSFKSCILRGFQVL